MSCILIADDEASIRETLRDILEDAGYEVVVAADAEAALRRVHERTVDVILMDMRMPGRDGVSVLEEVGAPGPPVIMMTGYASDEQLQRAVDARAYAVLHKPFSVTYLLDLVGEAASRQVAGV